MRWRNLLTAILGVCGSADALAVDFPYLAYVNSADVYVRSGPGRDYYPTDKLAKGAAVEIYRHDPGGWYAIRPPRQSYSWVSKRHLDTLDDGIAAVNSDRVVARVGSAFSDVREVIQVRLDKGEKVELLNPPSPDSPWCKIAPPAGEFRWVFSKYVDRQMPADLAEDEHDASGTERFSGNRESRSAQDVRLASGSEIEPATAEGRMLNARNASRSFSGEAEMERELNRIDLELSAMVSGEISEWSFADLQRRAESVLGQSQTPVERGRARILVNKLARFDDIKQRQEAVHQRQFESGRPGAQADAHRVDTSRFDGVGRLSPVISEKVGGPQFALVDNTNAVVSFITPAPGVNLRPYVDHYVGVNGQRGYMTDLQRQHISVQRVTMLETERR